MKTRTDSTPTSTIERADRAIFLLKQLMSGLIRDGEIILPGGAVFSCREYDNCFEMGDGDEVVARIMRASESDAHLLAAFGHDLAGRYLNLDSWKKTQAEVESCELRLG